MKKVAIYLRVSTEEQKKGHSIEGQEEEIRKRILDMDLMIFRIYNDAGLSGATDERPALKQMLEDAREHKFDVVYVWSFDRLFRDTKKMLIFVDTMSDYGVELVSIVDNINDIKEERLNFTIRAAIAEDERKKTAKRTELGRIMAAKQGKWMGGHAPYGYKINREISKLEINPEEAKYVKKFYKWFIEDQMTLYGLQKKINELKIPTRLDNEGKKKKINGACFWMQRTLGRILTNEVYTGIFNYRKYQCPRSRHKRVLRDKTDWIAIETPRIIKPEMFEVVRAQLSSNKKFAKKRAKQNYMLARLIECGECGRKWLSSYNNIKTKYYGCPRKRKAYTSELCSSHYTKCEKIDIPVWEQVFKLLKNPALIVSHAHKLAQKQNNLNKLREEEDILNKRLNTLRDQEKRLIVAYKSGKIELDSLSDVINENKADIEAIEDKLNAIQLRIGDYKTKNEQIDIVRRYAQTINENLDDLDEEGKRYICRKLIDKVVVKDDNLDINFNIPQISLCDSGTTHS